MKYASFGLAVLFSLSLVACKNDPVVKIINDSLRPDITHFELSKDVMTTDSDIDIRWEVESALIFDIKLYVSNDIELSEDDIEISDNECSYDDDCEPDQRTKYECSLANDFNFECELDGDLIGTAPLEDFLVDIPKTAYFILEACTDKCESKARRIEFE